MTLVVEVVLTRPRNGGQVAVVIHAGEAPRVPGGCFATFARQRTVLARMPETSFLLQVEAIGVHYFFPVGCEVLDELHFAVFAVESGFPGTSLLRRLFDLNSLTGTSDGAESDAGGVVLGA